MAILDTNIVIDILKGRKDVLRSLNALNIRDKYGITVITDYELRCVIDHRDLINRFLSSIEIYFFNDESSSIASDIYIALREKGRIISDTDILIAGIAISHNQNLITRDGDFKNIDNRLIQIIN